VAERVPWPVLSAYVFGFACVMGAGLGVALCVARPTRAALVAAALALAGLGTAWALGPSLWASALVLASLLSFGPIVGAAVGARIQHAGHVGVVALVSTFADAFSVGHPEAPSATLARSETALSLLAVPWPMLGTSRIEAVLGVGDLVFAGLYIAAARTHALSLTRTTAALVCAFVLAMLAVIATELPIPVLPFMGAAMVVVHPQVRLPPVQERRRALVMALAICGLFAGLLAYRLA
jgi:hypothetical protein